MLALERQRCEPRGTRSRTRAVRLGSRALKCSLSCRPNNAITLDCRRCGRNAICARCKSKGSPLSGLMRTSAMNARGSRFHRTMSCLKVPSSALPTLRGFYGLRVFGLSASFCEVQRPVGAGDRERRASARRHAQFLRWRGLCRPQPTVGVEHLAYFALRVSIPCSRISA